MDGSLSDAWERHAGRWERWTRVPGHDVYFEHFNWPAFHALLPPAGRRTLDVGCGEGRGGRRLSADGHRVTGIDSSQTLLALARESVARLENYFDEQRFADELRRDGLLMTFEGVDRPLQAYTRALSRAGFLIEELREPRPTPAAVAAAPELAEPASRPYFIHMRCILARDDR